MKKSIPGQSIARGLLTVYALVMLWLLFGQRLGWETPAGYGLLHLCERRKTAH